MSNNNSNNYILPEDYQRTMGREAQRINIMAAKAVSQAIRTTLGPRGMDKMIVDGMGDVIITNDGATILDEINIEHPAAKMMVEVSKSQEKEAGDGTTTAVVIAGELLKKSEDLLEQNIHPTIITKGYSMALQQAKIFLKEISTKINYNDYEILKQIAITAMTGKGAETSKEYLAEIIVKSFAKVTEENEGKIISDISNVKIEKIPGASVKNSQLIEGIVVDKEIVHSEMPKKLLNPKIALIDSPIEVRDTEMDAKIQITDPMQIDKFIKQEESIIRNLVEKIKASGANAVFCQKGIDDLAQHFLAKNNIIAVRRVKKSDMEKLARATKSKIINEIDTISSEDLGTCGIVNERKVGEEKMVFVEECENPKAVTLLIRGGTEHITEEIARAVDDVLGTLNSVIENTRIIAGAGAGEIELSLRLKKFAQQFDGKEQMAILAFAEALEIIPRTLAENAGMDPINIITKLKKSHEESNKDHGVDVFNEGIMNSITNGVIEPLKIKTQAITSATEVAEMILRIDDVIAGKKMNPQLQQQRTPEM